MDLKTAARARFDAVHPAIIDLSHRIHAHPELGFEEEQASTWLAEMLTDAGFTVEKGICDLPTAFVARAGSGPLHLALCAEYDCLPGIGHACGHNVIAAAGAGAGAALAAARTALPPGRVQIIGTPAEEGGGGKIRLIQAGIFEKVDAAMMVHGLDAWIGHPDLLGIVRVVFEFEGKAAHAAMDPWEGVNALDGVIQTFNNVAMLRQQVRPDARIHGIITNGGGAPNIIPEAAAATFYVRAPELGYMWELVERVEACAAGAATATGCALKMSRLDGHYEPMRRNQALLDAFRENMQALGVAESPPRSGRAGSSDVGNVSQVLPTIQPYVQIAPAGTPIHSRAFEAAAVTPLARDGMLKAAKIMAMTALDVLAEPALLSRVQQEFRASR
jgi:amidohydrolase